MCSLVKLATLPEPVGRWFTKQKTTDDQSLTKHRTAGATAKKGEDYGPMIGCDNDQ